MKESGQMDMKYPTPNGLIRYSEFCGFLNPVKIYDFANDVT